MWVNVLVLIASVYVIFKSADYLVDGVERYTHKLGLSNSIAGLFIISISASFPEMFSAVIAFLYGSSDIGVGTIIGNNLVHLGLITGLTLIFGTIIFKGTIIQKSFSRVYPILFVPFIFMLNGELSRIEGIILVVLFGYSFYTFWRCEKTIGKMHPAKFSKLWQDILVFSGCLAAMMLAARWLVLTSQTIATQIGMPGYLVGLVVVGVGACADDIAVVIKSMKTKTGEVALGDVFGSMLNELVFFLGIAAIIRPIKIEFLSFGNSLIWFVISLIVLGIALTRKKVSKKYGVMLFLAYILFVLIEILKLV